MARRRSRRDGGGSPALGLEDAPRFRRQHPLGPYVLDFYCPAARLVVDGAGHSRGDQPARDRRRDVWLEARGLEVMRIAANEILADPDEVAEGLVRLAVERASPPPSRA